jgi:phospholipase/carboxylesterase
VTDVPTLEALIEKGSEDGPVFVLLHGRGSDERDLLPVGRLLHPDATTVSVRAPFDAAPWGYGPGYAWYRFLGGTVPEPESFLAGQDALAQFLSRLPTKLGRAGAAMILGGFSQGGTSALAYLMRNPGSVRGVLVFSGFLADHPSVTVTPERTGETPIFWGHGTADFAVPYEAAEAGWATLRGAGAQLDAHAYPGMSHTISEQELADASSWVQTLLDETSAAPQ